MSLIEDKRGAVSMYAMPSLALDILGVRRNRNLSIYGSLRMSMGSHHVQPGPRCNHLALLAPVIPTRLLGARTPRPAATREPVAAISPVWAGS